MPAADKELTSYRKYWAARFGVAPFLPMSRAETDRLGWDCVPLRVRSKSRSLAHRKDAHGLAPR